MGRLICLDYGKKRIGVAVTDPLRIIASAVDTVPARDIRGYLLKYFEKENVDGMVVGYPRKLNNEPSEAVRYIDPFLEWFRGEFPDIPVTLYDERFTSKMAESSVIESGVPKMARRDKALVDRISAAIILQSYLDSEKNKKEKKTAG